MIYTYKNTEILTLYPVHNCIKPSLLHRKIFLYLKTKKNPTTTKKDKNSVLEPAEQSTRREWQPGQPQAAWVGQHPSPEQVLLKDTMPGPYPNTDCTELCSCVELSH